MISIHGIEYTENRAVNKRIIEYVNEVLADIVQCQIELHEDQKSTDGTIATSILESVSPRKMFRESPEKCEQTLYELYELITSHTIRKSIQARYNYALFYCIDNYLDVLIDEDDLINRILPEPLLSDLIAAGGEHIIDSITNLVYYPEICFWDWDFLPESISEMVGMYLDDSPFLSTMISVEELDELVEVMPADLQEMYIKKRTTQFKYDDEQKQFSEGTFTKKLLKSLIMIQGNRNLIDASEDDINDELRNHMSMVYDIHDQTRQGKSESGKNSGEVDLLAFENDLPVALVEGIKLNSVEKENISKHINKALNNYNPSGLKCVCLAVYSKANNFTGFLRSFKEYLDNYSPPYAIEASKEIDTGFSEIKHFIYLLNREKSEMHFHVFIANMTL